jgi:hypothetical protein
VRHGADAAEVTSAIAALRVPHYSVYESGDPVIGPDSDQKAWPATLGRVLVAGGPDAAYVPGHGAVVDADFVQRQGWMLRST